MEFKAAECFVGLEPDGDVFLFIASEQPDGDGRRIELQLAPEFDEQDAEVGMDTYCICLHGGETNYGGVASWSFSQMLLELRLSKDAAAVLGVESAAISIDLSMFHSKRKMIEAGLKRILDSSKPGLTT